MSTIAEQRIVLEAELILAPAKCVATMTHVAAAAVAFVHTYGRVPMAETLGALILKDLLHYEAELEDVQWFVDAELMPPSFVAEWEAARA